MTTYRNLCRWTAVSAGAGAFVVGAADLNCFTPAQMSVVDGKTYYYIAKFGNQWESGHGISSVSGTILTRIVDNYSVRNGDVSPVNFTSAPLVDVFPSPSSSLEQGQFPSGTRLVFQNSAAPTGWTRVATFDDAAIRVVGSAVPSSGGSLGISSAATGGHSLTLGEIPQHTHNAAQGSFVEVTSIFTGGDDGAGNETYVGDPATGGITGWPGLSAHTHPLALKYVDVILASKN